MIGRFDTLVNITRYSITQLSCCSWKYRRKMRATQKQKRKMVHWYRKNKTKRLRTISAYQKRDRDRVRLDVFAHYCGQTPHCQCPGCHLGPCCPHPVFIGFLQLDHVAGGGNKHTDERGNKLAGRKLWRWLRRMGYPPGYQILCANCNSPGGKGTKAACPMHGKLH